MGLTLQNEFTVAAPLDKTWETLLDIGRVANCMPGAKLEPAEEDGLFRGGMNLKLGPMKLAYQGTARLAEVDADEHVTTIDVKGKEARGQGTASATIRNRLVAAPDGGTRVIVETDMAVTGRQAQFGRGIMEDVASKMLGDFATRLEREILNPSAPEGVLPAHPGPQSPVSANAAGPSTPAFAPSEPAEVLDLGGVINGPLAKRAGVAAAGLAIASVAVWAVSRGRGRSRKGVELILRYR